MFTPGYKRYVAAVLTLVYTLSQVDQSLMSVALQPLQHDLSLSDTQIGFVTGIVFGLFYATVGIPVARWADCGNRSTIAAYAVGLWGLTVMSCMFVTGLSQLVIVRVAAAVAAAACMPPTYALLGDYFSTTTGRMRAMSLYSMANPLSGLIAYILGGWLTEHLGWRTAFMLMGLPGVVVAVLVRLTIAETRIRGVSGVPTALGHSNVRAALRLLWQRPSSRHLGIGIILIFTTGWGLTPWYAAFLMRCHGMDTVAVGMWLGGIVGVSGVAGIMLGGFVSNRWLSDDEPGQMRLTAICLALTGILLALFLLLPDTRGALTALALSMIMFTVFFGPAFTLMQRLSPPEMRATQLALVMLLANLIGMGVGSEAVGMVSDLLKPVSGQESLRYGMLAVSLVIIWAAYHFWRVARTVKADLHANTLIDDSLPSSEPVEGSRLHTAPEG